uniref:Uncharacterized protein n=1 Tax=Suricata suricatta TaxID=37032 RepID=A0A673VBN1_SURSU
MIQKNVTEELKRIIDDSAITKEYDALWPPSDRVSHQELKIVNGHEDISFTTSKIDSLVYFQSSYLETLQKNIYIYIYIYRLSY